MNTHYCTTRQTKQYTIFTSIGCCRFHHCNVHVKISVTYFNKWSLVNAQNMVTSRWRTSVQKSPRIKLFTSNKPKKANNTHGNTCIREVKLALSQYSVQHTHISAVRNGAVGQFVTQLCTHSLSHTKNC